MFCNKCGKNNKDGLSKCAHCGAPMSVTTKFSGFADILSFEVADKSNTSNSDSTERNDADMQKLIKKTDNIMSVGRKNSLFNLIAIGLSVVVLISSVLFGIKTMSSVNKNAEETDKRLEQIENKLTKISSGSESDELSEELETTKAELAQKEKELQELKEAVEESKKKETEESKKRVTEESKEKETEESKEKETAKKPSTVTIPTDVVPDGSDIDIE